MVNELAQIPDETTMRSVGHLIPTLKIFDTLAICLVFVFVAPLLFCNFIAAGDVSVFSISAHGDSGASARRAIPYRRFTLLSLTHCRHSMRLKVMNFIGCQMMGLRLRRSVM
jgi:hypothetical protein